MQPRSAAGPVPEQVDVVILGGGLAGLCAARHLNQAGIAFCLVEARDRLGGRILTRGADGAEGQVGGVDLGPSWYWPGFQQGIAALVAELGLTGFAQHSAGDLVFERSVDAPPQRYPSLPTDPPSMRISGGTAALVGALAAGLPAGALRMGCAVTGLALAGDGGVSVQARSQSGEGAAELRLNCRQVIAALPPRLMDHHIRFAPDLLPETRSLWQATPTWMAPHAKFVAFYDRAFWREAGLSGMAQSRVGPMAEVHDASTKDGEAALFGFLGLPADRRAALPEAALIRACTDQLARLFGPLAAQPRATLFKDWAADPWTATPRDGGADGHPLPADTWIQGKWRESLILAGSEVSPRDAGYLSGAVVAGTGAALQAIARLAGPA